MFNREFSRFSKVSFLFNFNKELTTVFDSLNKNPTLLELAKSLRNETLKNLETDRQLHTCSIGFPQSSKLRINENKLYF
jgi:hypothetical protein